MTGLALWAMVALSAIGLELVARFTGNLPRLGDLVGRMGERRVGRLGLWAIWAYLGWHLFGRYTIHSI